MYCDPTYQRVIWVVARLGNENRGFLGRPVMFQPCGIGVVAPIIVLFVNVGGTWKVA
jgi:hypothetical protein